MYLSILNLFGSHTLELHEINKLFFSFELLVSRNSSQFTMNILFQILYTTMQVQDRSVRPLPQRQEGLRRQRGRQQLGEGGQGRQGRRHRQVFLRPSSPCKAGGPLEADRGVAVSEMRPPAVRFEFYREPLGGALGGATIG